MNTWDLSQGMTVGRVVRGKVLNVLSNKMFDRGGFEVECPKRLR
jgi:hypothetical protein